MATAAFGATSKLWTGCSSAPPETQASSGGTASPVADKPIVIGFIYNAPKDDYGWNQAQAKGAAAIAAIPGIKIVEQESVPETKEVQEVMRNMIDQNGATVIVPTSFGYFDPHVLAVAKDYPEVQFFHSGTLWKEGLPKNVGSYFALIDEGQYLAGRIAAQTTKTGKLGFVGAKPINPVLRNINSFILGARSVKPDLKVQVIFTGDWSLPVKEAEATNSLADQGVDVVGVHVDSPKVVIETAEKRGIFSSGLHSDQSALAPKGYLTGTMYNWATIHKKYVELLKSGKTLMNGGIPHQVIGGLKEDYISLATFGPAVSEAAKKDDEATKAKIVDGSVVVYKGAIKDNTGAVKIPAGTSYKVTDAAPTQINWLAEGVIGKVS
ncbi:BMP family ABC transporter substrate-binding protein [Stenomitos frigidus ULC18]|uniref:BMP family ABC transporter substrate-binding protein n=2 Tax=Stenomitos TaxID=1844270 RepID=A0A2T1E513_9CYAN|nr:BMP family ABC transporter substrate-binding protein [Stenomitos frigidus ULC18]